MIQFAKNESYVRSQDYFIILSQISQNPTGSPLVWDFLRYLIYKIVKCNLLLNLTCNIFYGRDEWQYLVNRFSLNDRSLGKLIPAVCSSFNTQRRLDEVNIINN